MPKVFCGNGHSSTKKPSHSAGIGKNLEVLPGNLRYFKILLADCDQIC